MGGSLCLIGQLLIDRTKLTPARILVAYVVTGVLLGGLGIYQHLIDFAGAGATVPLTGFGALLAKGTRQAIQEQGPLGILSGGLTALRSRCGGGYCAEPPGRLFLPFQGQALMAREYPWSTTAWRRTRKRKPRSFSMICFKG